MSPNPFKRCPACGSSAIDFLHNKEWNCRDCGFTYFHNVASAAGILIHTGEQIVTLKRNMDPGKGFLALPGGFVDPGESAEEAAVRECKEELGIEIESREIHFFKSAGNRYVFKGIEYATCDFIFTYHANNTELADWQLEKVYNSEVASVEIIKIGNLLPEAFAFSSVRNIIKLWKEAFLWQAN